MDADQAPDLSTDAGIPTRDLDPSSLIHEAKLGETATTVVHRVAVDDGESPDALAVKHPARRGTLTRRVVEQFRNEAEQWARLDGHPNVVDVVDWGHGSLPWLHGEGSLPWIAMELMDGGDLSDVAGDLGVEQSLWTATVVTDGVWHAHKHGVVHLDLKPSNVLFADRGPGTWAVPKVADWELSRSLLDESADVGITTPRYVAPEQARGDETDHRTDQFQLGVALYELFAGRHPFVADPSSVPEGELVSRIREGDPTPPSRVRSALPPELDDVLLRAIATNPSDRYEATIDLRRAFERIADGESPNAPGTDANRRDRQSLTGEPTARPTTGDGSSADGASPSTGADRSREQAVSGGTTAQSGSSDETPSTDDSRVTDEIRATDETHVGDETSGWFAPDDYPEVTRRRLATAIRAEKDRSVNGPLAGAIDASLARESESIAAALNSMRAE